MRQENRTLSLITAGADEGDILSDMYRVSWGILARLGGIPAGIPVVRYPTIPADLDAASRRRVFHSRRHPRSRQGFGRVAHAFTRRSLNPASLLSRVLTRSRALTVTLTGSGAHAPLGPGETVVSFRCCPVCSDCGARLFDLTRTSICLFASRNQYAVVPVLI